MEAGRPVLLIVDDDPDILVALTLFLRQEGFDVVTAENGKLALDQLEAGLRPSLILLDLMMPVMSGWQFWDRHQTDAALRDIPLVILSATGLRTGAVGNALILAKPIDADSLLVAIRATAARVPH